LGGAKRRGLAVWLFRPGTLYAIEPIKAKIENLRRRFPTIELHECALGELDGEVAFFVDIRVQLTLSAY
jgi:hypothetical protein